MSIMSGILFTLAAVAKESQTIGTTLYIGQLRKKSMELYCTCHIIIISDHYPPKSYFALFICLQILHYFPGALRKTGEKAL